LTGGALKNWFHHFVGLSLHPEPETLEFNFLPMLISIVIALTGLALGFLVYRRVKAGQEDPLKVALGPLHTLLKNKYYFDELYDRVFVRPVVWLAETFTNVWMDRGLIDGILHTVARVLSRVGYYLRHYFDLPVINQFIGDGLAGVVQTAGKRSRVAQTGRVQQYMLAALIFAIGAMFFFMFR
jgi:NADH-quinone oxidoreductase subunit L